LKPKDRDFLETNDGLFFCVVGYLHPPDRITAYLKYIPSKTGKWRRENEHYKRMINYYHVNQVEKTYTYLKTNFPKYLFNDKIRNIVISTIPKKDIKTYYDPRERLNKILGNPNDILEERLCEIIERIQNLVEIKNDIGITGSMLTKSHNPEFSDLDITIYGKKNILKIKKAVLELKSKGIMRNLSKKELEAWCTQRSEKFPLTIPELKRIASQRWNFGYYKNTYFSFHPTRSDEEIKEKYGENKYYQIDETKGIGVITDVSESMYNPAIYEINQTKLNNSGKTVSEIVSFESIYADLFNTGEKVEFKGILEKVSGKNDYFRIVLGGAGSKNSFVRWV
jgi:predicted nucleotidyltransferase